MLNPAFGESEIAYWKSIYQRGLQGETVREVHAQLLPEGQKFTAISLFPIFNQEREIVGLACYSEDATERMQYIEAIEQQNRQLREIGWAQSHLVRAPLTNIMGLAELIVDKQGRELDAEGQTNLRRLAREAELLDEKLREIINKTREVPMPKTAL